MPYGWSVGCDSRSPVGDGEVWVDRWRVIVSLSAWRRWHYGKRGISFGTAEIRVSSANVVADKLVFLCAERYHIRKRPFFPRRAMASRVHFATHRDLPHRCSRSGINRTRQNETVVRTQAFPKVCR